MVTVTFFCKHVPALPISVNSHFTSVYELRTELGQAVTTSVCVSMISIVIAAAAKSIPESTKSPPPKVGATVVIAGFLYERNDFLQEQIPDQQNDNIQDIEQMLPHQSPSQ